MTLLSCRGFDKQDTPTQDFDVNISATGVQIIGRRYFGNTNVDIKICSDATDTDLWPIEADTIDDSGVRTRWNGVVSG